MKIVLMMSYGNHQGLDYLREFAHQRIKLHSIIFQGDVSNPQWDELSESRYGTDYEKPFIGDLLGPTPPAIHFVRSHNSDKCRDILRGILPDIVVLGGVDIIHARILREVALGAINTHPGMLPYYRGCCCVEWALYNDDPVGSTCHLVTSSVDGGPIIYQEPLHIASWDTYQDVRRNMLGHSSKVMAKGLLDFITYREVSKPSEEGTLHPVIPAGTLKKVLEKMEKHQYKLGVP